jgi:ankyrin repeat protein
MSESFGLLQAKQNVSAFIGKHGIYEVKGDDRVKVFTTDALSTQVLNNLANAAFPHRVDVFEGDGKAVKVVEVPRPKPAAPIVPPVDEPQADEPETESPVTPPSLSSDVNAKGKWGYTLLHVAAMQGDEAECERLLALGANKKAKDNSGKMPWQKAQTAGHEALAEKLK